MPYILNKYDGNELTVLDDGTVNVTATSINLIGRNYFGYGEKQNENFVYLLENFANSGPPLHPIKGQAWFDTTINLLKVYDGTNWNIVGSAVVSETEPLVGNIGSLWLKIPHNVLYTYNGTNWTFVGPESAEGFATTKAESSTLLDSSNVSRPVILFKSNGTVLAIASEIPFTIHQSNFINGFTDLVAGITVSAFMNLKGDLIGKADRATRLETTRLINGVGFNGQSDITIRASTVNKITPGAYIIGDEFDGGSPETWAIDATPTNSKNKIVARDASGNFSAGIITASFHGELRGNVTTTEGSSYFNVCYANNFIGASLSGNASTATRLQTPRKINGVEFSGIEDITISSSAETLTGTYLNPNVSISNLTKVGQLTTLFINDAGISIGTEVAKASIKVTDENLIINSKSGILKLGATSALEVNILNSSAAASLGGVEKAAIAPEIDQAVNLGLATKKFDKFYSTEINTTTVHSTEVNTTTMYAEDVYATNLLGTSTNAINLVGGASNSIPYQTSAGTTAFIAPGNAGNFLRLDENGAIAWQTAGTWENIPGEFVVRNLDGDFAARNLLGNALTATKLKTPRKINGVDFDGTQDITVHDPDIGLINNYTITYGNTVSAVGYSNIVGSFSNNTNYFDVFPPQGKSMLNLVAFIPSIAVIHYAGNVNGDDSLRCTWTALADRIRVYVQNTEQRSTPAANYMAVWR